MIADYFPHSFGNKSCHLSPCPYGTEKRVYYDDKERINEEAYLLYKRLNTVPCRVCYRYYNAPMELDTI